VTAARCVLLLQGVCLPVDASRKECVQLLIEAGRRQVVCCYWDLVKEEYCTASFVGKQQEGVTHL
jgi:hypothetical protein